MKKPTIRTENPPPATKNVYHISGIPVEFPYKPYGTQLAFMSRVITTLDRAHREGHCHALLESPTGTGKSLSLLCSAVSWQQHRGPAAVASASQSRPDPRAAVDPINHGGGFVLDSQLSESSTQEGEAEAAKSATKTQKKKVVPTIYYASRTHSQITQVVREFRKTSYRVPMAVLASRKHYCTNAKVRGGDNLDEECKLLLEDKENGCPQFKNVHRVKHHPSVQKGGCHEVHDIEDLVKIGKAVKGCSYYAARSMADDAHIVFCPYSYIINPVIRRAMEVDIRGAILVLDEAHNIEDMSREAGSFDVDDDALQKLQTELGQLCGGDALTYQPLYELVQDIISWMERRKGTLEKRDFQHYVSCWTGNKAQRELQEANISQQCFPILQECAVKAIKAASDSESGLPHLSGMSAASLEGLFSSLSYFFHENGLHVQDYQLVLQRFVKKDTANASGCWTFTLSLWCLNPAVVFRNIADLSLSVILTSGTLSPMSSFSSELGITFGSLLEAPHVINVDEQVWASVISRGPSNYPLNASYKTADVFAFQDAIGQSLEEIFKVAPGGSLVFFPSYKLMDKLCKRWRQTGQWSRLNARKPLFVEPRGGNQEDLETVLKGYYSSIHQGKKPALGKRRKAKKVDLNISVEPDTLDTCAEGAAFLAVFRGKVSEGIDFSDENARTVIIVGIPFPNIYDIQVAEKKRYNDTYKHSKKLLSGSDWYCQQAFRALNQAAGRCIRHNHDYGAIIFMDERFREDRNTIYISKWLRKSIRTSEKFETSIEELKSFFCNVKDHVCGGNMLKDVTNLQSISSSDCGKESPKRKSQKFSKPRVSEKKLFVDNLVAKASSLSHHLSFKADDKSADMNVSRQSKDEAPFTVSENEKDSVDMESNYGEDLRYGAPSPASLDEGIELSVVRETPTYGSCTLGSPDVSMNRSPATLIQTVTEFGQACSDSCSLALTPDRSVITKGVTPEVESSISMSINSHAQRRRVLPNSLLINSIQRMEFDIPAPGVTDDFRETNISRVNDYLNQKNIVVSKTNSSACELTSGILSPSPKSEHDQSFKSADLGLDQQLQIFCSVCKSPLGRHENSFHVTCCLTSLSKVALTSLCEANGPSNRQSSPSLVPVLITDLQSVDHRLYGGVNKDKSGQGIWCQEDGCVYNTIFCPFCISLNQCLGVQIVATDASNIQLVDKILFFSERIEYKCYQGRQDCQRESSSPADKIVRIDSIDKYAYRSPQQSSGGWRTTKSKSRLPKRSPSSNFLL